MERSDRYCVTCGKILEESVSKNAITHPGTCRDENTQSLLKKHNLQVKIDKIRSILTFLEEQFDLGIDVELLTGILSKINMYHTTTEDFVMTAYYLMSNESRNGITIRDITDVAYTWDERNGKKRSDSSKRQIIDQIKLLDKYIDTTSLKTIMSSISWRDDIQRVLSRTKTDIDGSFERGSPDTKECIEYINRIIARIRSIVNVKIGYNKNAYNILKEHIDFVLHSIDDRIPSVIAIITTKLLIDQRYVTEMMDIYTVTKPRLIGRDATIVVGGIVYYISQKYDLGLSQEAVAMITRTSVPSIRKIYYILTDRDDDTHDTTKR